MYIQPISDNVAANVVVVGLTDEIVVLRRNRGKQKEVEKPTEMKKQPSKRSFNLHVHLREIADLCLLGYCGCCSFGAYFVKKVLSERRLKVHLFNLIRSPRPYIISLASRCVKKTSLLCARNHRCVGNYILPVRDAFVMRAFEITFRKKEICIYVKWQKELFPF